MFEKNDKQLFTVRTLLNVIVWIFVIAGVISGIVFLVGNSIAIGLLLLLFVPFLSWIIWVVARLYLTYLCDIKLIRNKLYGLDNDGLKVFLEEKVDTSNQSVSQSATESVDKTTQLLKLKSLLDNRVITQEEFDDEKKKYLG